MFEQSRVDQDARAELFATLLEETGTGRHHRRPDEPDEELTALVGLANQLGTLPQPTVRAEFRDELRARLIDAYGRGRVPGQRAMIRLVPPPEPPPEPVVSIADTPPDTSNVPTQAVRVFRPPRGRRARLAAVIGVATGALALSGVSVASTGAMPGDPLYPVKQAGEKAALVVAGSDANRGHLRLDFARSRLVEAGQVDPSAVAGVLAQMDQETTEGVRLLFSAAMQQRDAGPIDSVLAFVSQQRGDVLQLRASVAAPGDPTRRSLDLLDAVEIRANELRAALANHCDTTTVDQLGPKPTC